MRFRMMGNSGLQVSVVGLECMVGFVNKWFFID